MTAHTFQTGCTIEVEQTPEFFHAHVELDGDIAIGPGDKVRVHGAPVQISFGQRRVERRTATVERATWWQRHWTKLTARFELTELYEVSFTPRRMP